jgi:hypothetical protein
MDAGIDDACKSPADPKPLPDGSGLTPEEAEGIRREAQDEVLAELKGEMLARQGSSGPRYPAWNEGL